MVLLIFTGSAAEFALNREVDWLFFTGKLPADPVGRLISTASHARQIVFADELTATCCTCSSTIPRERTSCSSAR